MSINQRLLILFVAILIAFSAFFYLFYHIRQKESKVYHEADQYQRKMTIESIFDIKKGTQLRLVDEYSIWDDMYRFTQNGDSLWAKENLGHLIHNFGYSLIQIYDIKRNLIYASSDLNLKNAANFRFEPSAIDSIHSKRAYFFTAKHQNQLLATAAATIHPSGDSLRTTPPGGYIFISHTWDSKYLGDMAKSLNYMIKIRNTEPTEDELSSTQYNIRILRPILDWQGNPISWLIFYNSNPFLQQLQLIGKQIIFGTGGFLLIFLILQYALLQHWITYPLKLISHSLKESDPSYITPLNNHRNEFADIAILIERFFSQKEELIKEIEERVKTESKLREIEEQTRKIFSTSPESIIVTDLLGNIISVNDETLRLFAIKADPQGMDHLSSVFNLVIPEELGRIKTIVKALPQEALVKNEELNLCTAEDRVFPALLSASVIYDSKNDPNKLVFISRDISDLKALETQLRQSQKMESIGTLAGGIAHDFNNIITIIGGYIAISAGKIDGFTEARNDLDEALKACLRAQNLVSKILTFSKISDLDIKPIALAETIEDSLPMLRASIPASISITADLRSSKYTKADPTEIQQILMNLCSNAYYAIKPKEGKINIKLSEVSGFELIGVHTDIVFSTDYLHFMVEDTGSGIPPELIERIFDPYFSTKAAGEGSGLGLSIVHGIVSSYHGFLNVESQVGKGTTFNIYLPVTDYLADETPGIPKPEYGFAPARILFVDDEPALAELFAESLRSAGYSVQTFSDSQKAFKHFIQSPESYDLLVADVTMPNMDGLKLSSLIRSQRQIPVILYTGFRDQRIQSEASQLGINRLLNKPLLPNDLLRIIRQVVAEDMEQRGEIPPELEKT